MIIWTARCARNTLLIDRHTAAAIGAKNGCGCAEHIVGDVPGQTRRDRGLQRSGTTRRAAASMAAAAAVGSRGKQRQCS